ncbi:MAG: hypothetical protein ACLFQT_11925, partial [Thiohalophilus sp.]
MKHNLAKHIPLLFALSLSTSLALAQDEPIYGQQLMSEQERAEHREQMRNMESEEEREAFREEHHERMQQRAEERGVELPDEPGQRGRMNRDGERGQGMEQGQNRGRG